MIGCIVDLFKTNSHIKYFNIYERERTCTLFHCYDIQVLKLCYVSPGLSLAFANLERRTLRVCISLSLKDSTVVLLVVRDVRSLLLDQFVTAHFKDLIASVLDSFSVPTCVFNVQVANDPC